MKQIVIPGETAAERRQRSPVESVWTAGAAERGRLGIEAITRPNPLFEMFKIKRLRESCGVPPGSGKKIKYTVDGE